MRVKLMQIRCHTTMCGRIRRLHLAAQVILTWYGCDIPGVCPAYHIKPWKSLIDPRVALLLFVDVPLRPCWLPCPTPRLKTDSMIWLDGLRSLILATDGTRRSTQLDLVSVD
jgi:hypothetical protein